MKTVHTVTFIFFASFILSAPGLSALGPNADMPEIPGPIGAGLSGLHSKLQHSRLKLERPEDQAAAEKTEPDIFIPSPSFPVRKTMPETASAETKTGSLPDQAGKQIQKADRPKAKHFSALPANLKPTPVTGFRYAAPDFYQGLYINQGTVRSDKKWNQMLRSSRKNGMNVLVVDVQPKVPDAETLQKAKDKGFYLVARVVVFEGGLKQYPPSLEHIDRVKRTAQKAVQNGFMEIQLDYIRFADRLHSLKLPLKDRYRLMEGILKTVTDAVRPRGIRVGADIFGRIAFNKDDTIGQKLEVFAPHLDTIYPMLYPSHFYGDPGRMKDPYGTIKDGTNNCVRRAGQHSKIIAYIQAFRMNVKKTGLSYKEYIRKQIQASEDADGSGYIVWNAANQYDEFFDALQSHRAVAGKNTDDSSTGNTR